LFSSTSNPNRLTSVKDIAGAGGPLPPACSLMHDGGGIADASGVRDPIPHDFSCTICYRGLLCAHQSNQEESGKTARPVFRGGLRGLNPPPEKSKTCSRMHQNAPFRRKNAKIFLGRGTAPSPDPTPWEGNTPSQTPPPSTPSAPPFECRRHSTPPPDHISGYGPEDS